MRGSNSPKTGAKIQAIRCPAGDCAQSPRGGRSRGGPTTKIHALTDACGRAVAFILGPGNGADISAAPALLDKLPPPTRLLAPSHGLQTNHCRATDKGYDANSLRARLAASKTEAVIPSTRSRRTPIPYDAVAYIGRNLIERAFCRLKDSRRIATRYDKLAINFESAIAIAAVIIWWT